MNRINFRRSVLGLTIALSLAGGSFSVWAGNSATGQDSFVGGGDNNQASGLFASIGGGRNNQADGLAATVSGGETNKALENNSFIGAGKANEASGIAAAIGGGWNNTASGRQSFIGSGDSNGAVGDWSSISGGHSNIASGQASYIGGGFENTASNYSSSIGGGSSNRSLGNFSTVSGGFGNIASGEGTSVLGGMNNFANAHTSVVVGGLKNKAGANGSFAAGSHAHVRDSLEANNGKGDGDYGTFVWSDASSASDFVSSGPNQFLVRADGGFALNGTPPQTEVEMTIISNSNNNNNSNYANLFLRQNDNNSGILMTAGDASPDGPNLGNNASFYIDQYNSNTQLRRLEIRGNGDFAVTANAYKPGGGAWAAPSDARLKTNVQPLEHALDQVLNLRGVTFEYAHPDANLHPAGTHVGFIAQEVQTVFPNWVGQSPDGYLTVGPKGFEALTVEALRELKTTHETELSNLHAQLDKQTEINRNLTNAIVELRQQMANLTK